MPEAEDARYQMPDVYMEMEYGARVASVVRDQRNQSLILRLRAASWRVERVAGRSAVSQTDLRLRPAPPPLSSVPVRPRAYSASPSPQHLLLVFVLLAFPPLDPSLPVPSRSL